MSAVPTVAQRILLVEDSDVQALELRSVLEATGYEVTRAASAEQALELLNHSIPDLIIADLELPNMDGRELTRTLRQNPRTRAVPVLMVTSASAREDERAGLESGADAYVQKSRDPQPLLMRAAALLRSARLDTPQEGADFRRARVVVLDSSATQRLNIQQLLANDFMMQASGDLDEVLRSLSAPEAPDCIIVNLLDVRIDGVTACERLAHARDTEGAAPLGCLIVGVGGRSLADGDLVRAAFLAGADDVVGSIADTELLRLRLRALLRRQAVQREVRRLEAERASAHATSEHFRLLVEGVLDYAIFMLDTDGKVTTWNGGAERIKGYSSDEIIGQHFSRFYTEQQLANNEPQRALNVAREEGRYEVESQRVRKDGAAFWAHVVIDPIFSADRELLGYAKITRDISERRQAAEQLQEARVALMQAQKMEAIGQLTGGIAHDFNNMLAGIIGGLSLLERRINAKRYDETKELIDAALTSANRAASLTSRLLAFGRRQSLDIQPNDVNAIVASMRMLVERTVSENITFDTAFEKSEAWAMTDASQLESAILNLVINARDAMPDGGHLRVETKAGRIAKNAGGECAPGDYVLITVRDTGHGMTKEVLAKIFDPFFTTKPIGQGTGLGLSMVYGFMRQAGGQVLVESEVGKGTAVTMWLPRANAQKQVEPVQTLRARGAGETVLVVEDDPQVRLMIGEALKELGYNSLLHEEAAAALPILEDEAQHIDLLITDVGLPGMDGRKLAEIARSVRPDLKVLFITGYAQHAGVRSEFLSERMAMIVKPFSLEGFADAVNQMLSPNA
ncbi:response regulator [Terricaulis sp.]|uniref:response regulator n=1 Tax=Terricaulis sp. TaxID=2768686 RepID=UPI002AC6F433|nr:response regulator [Terricaulis sp.]MDZ4693185.1 response regulator [Terricaulis sp.]